MRVPTNSNTSQMIDRISLLSYKQAKLQTQVSTGQRIFQPEDDPAATGRVMTLDNERRQLRQYADNADYALDLSTATFSVFDQIKTISDRAGEISTLATGSVDTSCNAAYAAEVDQLIEQGLQLSNSKLRNDYLFAGTDLSTPAFTSTEVAGQITAVTYAGNADSISIRLSENAEIAPGSSAQNNNDVAGFLNHLIQLRDALTANDQTAVATARNNLLGTDTIEGDEKKILSAMSQLGAIQTRIEISSAQRGERLDNLESLISSEIDVDLPEAITRLSQTSMAYQAALQSAAQIMQISLLDYI